MQLNDEEVLTTFQSRIRRQEWLQPYTNQTLKELHLQIKLIKYFRIRLDYTLNSESSTPSSLYTLLLLVLARY